jgi:hypothetical protein
VRFPRFLVGVGLALALLAGCTSPPEPHSTAAPPPPEESAPPSGGGSSSGGSSTYQVGAADSVGAMPGSPDALYKYRFKQIDPASERFTFQDRDLSFYFRPAPDALHFQVENRQNRPVWIDWERSQIFEPLGNSGKVAHASTRWADRFGVQAPTQIMGLQRYGDYLLPMDYLLDPGGSDEQVHRPLFPENESAQQYDGREFGVDLQFRVEDRPRTYSFRFRVASVLPR